MYIESLIMQENTGREAETERGERKIPSPTQRCNTALAQPSQILGPTSTRLETSPDEQKLMEFFTTRPAPQDRLKEDLPIATKGR